MASHAKMHTMFKNYLKTAWRNLWKNKTSAVINTLGLTIGLTCCLLISLYLQYELSYDRAEAKRDRIARVIMEYSFSEGANASVKIAYTSVRVAPVLKRNFAEVEEAVRMGRYERVIRYKDKLINEKEFLYADSTFFDVFSSRLSVGDARTALSGPNKVILTASTAKKYFGNDNPVGQSFLVGSSQQLYQITGIIPDCPPNSQIRFDFLASFSSLGLSPDKEKTYWDANYFTYLLLRSPASIASLQAKLPAFMQRETKGLGATINFTLEPFSSIHLHSPYDGLEPNSSMTYIYILAAVALLILVIACFTYINLSTARSVERAREVGVRKVMGAGRKQLFWQFIGESVMLCLVAAVCSFIIAAMLLSPFNQLTGRQLQLSTLLSIPFISLALIVAVCVGLFAGSYPAFVLTGFQPVKVLKGSFSKTGSGRWIRQSLIVFQFAISVFLIVCTFTVQHQLYFIQHKKLGYDREHVLVLPMDSKMLNIMPLIKQEFKTIPQVVSVSRSVRTPVEGGGGYNMRSATMREEEQVAVAANPVDEDYIKTSGLQLVAGSDLTLQDMKDAAEDSTKKAFYHFILNESAARQLGWTPEEAINKPMFLDGGRPGVVKGVVKDYHFESMHNPIKPIVLFPEEWGRVILVKLSGQDLPQTIARLEAKWKSLPIYRPFEYRFMDDDYNKLYRAEDRLGRIMNLFAMVAIALACLGLFGLSSYAVKQRVKEIGVRKVLGASVGSIALTLSKDFFKLTLIAILIASPFAWWMASGWLQGFSYRISNSWYIYVIAGMITALLALLTAGSQAVKAALANPVKSLRAE